MYQKITDDGYIIAIASGCTNGNITKAEYNEIMSAIQNHPEAPEGYDYKLKEDLTWEMYELPPEPQPADDDEMSEYEIAQALEGILQ